MKHFKSFRNVILLFIAIISIIIISACRPDNKDGTTDVTSSTSASEATTVATTPTPETTPTSETTPSPTPDVDLSLFAIKPKYSYAEEFNKDGYAVVAMISDSGYMEYQIIDENGSDVFGPVDWVLLDQGPNLSPFCENGKYGYINSKFEVVIEPEYDSGSRADEDGCYPVEKNGKWGRIDEANQWICLPQFDAIEGYYSDGETGFIKISNDGVWGVADRSGNIIIEPKYSWIGLPNEIPDFDMITWYPNKTGLFMICLGENYEKSGLADKNGNILFEPVAEYGFLFAENGLAAVTIDGKTGYLNAQGKIVIEPQYNWAYMFNSDGLAKVEFEDYRYAYIDETGRLLDTKTVEAKGVFEFTRDGISFGTKDGVTGLFNSEGKCIFDTKGNYPYITEISGKEVYYIVFEDKSVFVDLKGNIIFEYPVIVEHVFTEDGTMIFRENEKYGMMDTEGNRLIEPVYERVYGDWNSNYHEGGNIINYSDRELVMTQVQENYLSSPMYGILSSDGQELLPPICPNYIIISANGMVPVQVGELYGYIHIDLG